MSLNNLIKREKIRQTKGGKIRNEEITEKKVKSLSKNSQNCSKAKNNEVKEILL